jgi:hypothetical protein
LSSRTHAGERFVTSAVVPSLVVPPAGSDLGVGVEEVWWR